MNKYRKAFNNIIEKGITDEYFNQQSIKEIKNNNIFIIQELIDKEIKIKPIEIRNTHNNYMYHKCKKCNETLFKIWGYKYCNECGQKIDWSDEK